MPESWWNRADYAQRRPNLKIRAAGIAAVRQYFWDRGFLEVETPSIQVSPGIDRHIRPIRLSVERAFDNSKLERYLHTSPEFAMKKLLAAGEEKIFQICHVYRDKEEGRLHQPEFTMLEWYRANETYEVLMEDVVDLMTFVAHAASQTHFRHGPLSTAVSQDWHRVTVSDLFLEYAGINLLAEVEDQIEVSPTSFIEKARSAGMTCQDNDQWDDVFHRVMLEKIEPQLASGPAVLVTDFPRPVGALARMKSSDHRVCERVEAYVCGLELANGFSELIDPIEQRRRFKRDQVYFGKLYGEGPTIDEDFLAALDQMPDAAGMALGIDRMAMLLSGAKNIQDVMWSPINLSD